MLVKILPEPQSPRAGLALSDLQSTSTGGTYAIGGGGISGLAIASHGSSSWSTRGVGGIGAGLSGGSASPSSSGIGGFGGAGLNQERYNYGPASGLFNNCGCASNDYGLFKK
ncbi:hypothetical protein AAVH_04798 [Aphelenchoides avenae]|nr:hypothetical protein AAVH_04798 [Aphelenchus avenae]